MLCYHHELLLLCWRRGLTLGTILATWPDTQPSPVNGEKRHNERNVTLRSKMHSAMHRHLRNHLIGERQNTTSGEKRMLLSMCMCVKMSLWQTFLLRFFSMLSTAKTCSPAAGSSIFRCERSGSSCRFSLCFRYPTPYPRFRAVFFFFLPAAPLMWNTRAPLLLLFSLRLFPRFPPRRDSFCRRVGNAARKHFMQIAVDVTSDEGEVIGAGVVPALLSGAVGKKWNHDCHRVRTCNRTLNSIILSNSRFFCANWNRKVWHLMWGLLKIITRYISWVLFYLYIGCFVFTCTWTHVLIFIPVDT